jgi:hypothetical protein
LRPFYTPLELLLVIQVQYNTHAFDPLVLRSLSPICLSQANEISALLGLALGDELGLSL